MPNPEIAPPGGTGYLLSVNYYDVYKRLIQSVSDNHLGGIDIVSNQINFTGDILFTKENHFNGSETIIVETKYEYDNGKRLTKTKHRINNAPAWTTLSHNKYDELGRVKRKYLHGSSGNSLQTVDYKYNIRDWLTDINDVASLGGDLFGVHLGYTTGVHPQFNGNISIMQWKTNMFGQSNYNFDYDGVNRLISADYTGIGSHNTTYGYDFNGNILTLTREGKYGASNQYGMIDELTYGYYGDQLKFVNDIDDNNGDAHHQNNGFSDNGSTTGTDEYDYDANGNMISDDNKNMAVIEYNYLNLPQQITINSNNNANAVNYLYDAMETKLRKQTGINNMVETTTDYLGSFVYEDNVLNIHLNKRRPRNGKPRWHFQLPIFLKGSFGKHPCNLRPKRNGNPGRQLLSVWYGANRFCLPVRYFIQKQIPVQRQGVTR